MQTPNSKIFTIEDFNASFDRSKKLVFTNGCFDILHHGHVDYLFKARQLGDALMVGLNTDVSVRGLKGAGRPVNDESARAMVLASLYFVDYVILFSETTPINLITAVKPNVLVKGGDYTRDTIVGADFVESIGGKVVVLPLLEGFSTTNIINKVK